MLDAEIYVDRIADMRIKDMNTVLEATRQIVLMEHGEEANDLYLHTLKAAQIQEEEYFGHLVADDLSSILRDIREEHRTDALTADDDLSAVAVQKQLMETVHFEGSSEEKKIRAYLATLGIYYDTLTKEEFVSLIGILKKSKHMKSPISQRGKTTMTHGKGKRKKRGNKDGAAAGRGLYIPSLPFPASRILLSRNPAFVSPWCHKIRLSSCR